MRFRSRLDETLYPDALKKFMEMKCSQFMNEVKGTSILMYRGTKKLNSVKGSAWKLFSSHLEERIPRDTHPEIHKISNEIFEERFGWRVRNGVFAGDWQRAASYGIPFIFVPLNGYKYVWSKAIKDFFVNVSNEWDVDRWAKNFKNTKQLKSDWIIDNEPSIVPGKEEVRGYWDFEGKKYKSIYDVTENKPIHLIKLVDGYAVAVIKNGKLVGHSYFHPYQEFEEYEDEKREEIYKFIKDKVNTYQDYGLKQALEYGNEICFNIQRYLMIDNIHRDFVFEILGK